MSGARSLSGSDEARSSIDSFAGADDVMRGVGGEVLAGPHSAVNAVAHAVTQAVGALASGAGQAVQVAALERRAAALEKTVEKQVRGRALGVYCVGRHGGSVGITVRESGHS